MSTPLAASAELVELAAVADAFARDHLDGARERFEATGVVGADLVAALDRAGLLDVGVAEAHGGQGGGRPAALLVVERLARVSPTAAMVVVHAHAAAPAGTAVAFARGAEVHRIDAGLGAARTVVWDGAASGLGTVAVGAAPARTGLPGLGTATGRVDGPLAPVPGPDDPTAWWVLGVAAAALGAAAGAAGRARAYGGQRRQFGGPLTALPAYAAVLADLDATLTGLGGLVAAGDPARMGPVLDGAVRVALTAVQLHGGYGYLHEYGVEGLARDTVSLRAAALAAAR